MQTATTAKRIKDQSAAQPVPSAPKGYINAGSCLTSAGRIAASELDQKQALGALEELFKDAFLYGFKAQPDSFGYDFRERENILNLYEGFKAIIPMLCGYHWPAGGGSAGETPVKEDDYEVMYEYMENRMDMKDCVPELEGMLMTTIIYKYVEYGDHAADMKRVVNIHNTFLQLRGLIEGYIPQSARNAT